MTQPYPAGFQGPPYLAPPPRSRFRQLRGIALATITLCLATAALFVVHTVLFWSAFRDLEVDLAEALNDDDADGLSNAIQQTMASGVLSNLTWTVALAAGIVFLVWLYQARENTEVIAPYSRHRLSKGWAIGSWFCPAVQFWFPLTIVDDVLRASTPPDQRVRGRGLVYGWWAAWILYWLAVIVGSIVGVVTLVSWSIWISDAAEQGGVDDVAVRADIVRFVRGVTIGLGVASGLLAVAAVLMSLVVWRITRLQEARGPVAFVPGLQPTPYGSSGYEPSGYGPSYGPPSGAPQFPSYGRPQDRP